MQYIMYYNRKFAFQIKCFAQLYDSKTDILKRVVISYIDGHDS